eukprot:scaffold56577_cov37-Tisochrysis_lutea.AAC.8
MCVLPPGFERNNSACSLWCDHKRTIPWLDSESRLEMLPSFHCVTDVRKRGRRERASWRTTPRTCVIRASCSALVLVPFHVTSTVAVRWVNEYSHLSV